MTKAEGFPYNPQDSRARTRLLLQSHGWRKTGNKNVYNMVAPSTRIMTSEWFLYLAIFASGVIVGRLTMAIQYALMKPKQKQKK